MTRIYGLTLILTLFTISLFGQEKLAELQFVNTAGFDCENTPNVCYEIQIRSNTVTPDPFKLFGINVRMFFDMAVLEHVSTTIILPAGSLYAIGDTEIETPVDNVWGMGMPRYLRFNMNGTGFANFSATITEAWTPVTTLCFNVVGTPPDDFCGSLVWDLEQDGEGGFQSGNDGVVVLEQDELIDFIQLPLDEEVIQYNWEYTENTAGVPNFATQCIPTDCPDPVAVDLISFNARRSANVSVLNWITTNEIDNDHFDVQRSKDGITFEQIGVVKAPEQPLDINKYEFIDKNPLAGRNYYRLNQVDLDGTSELTEIRSVDFFEGKLKIETFPNPTSDYIFVDLGLEDLNAREEFTVKLVDLSGMEIESQVVDVEAATRVKFNMTSLPAGTYVLKVISGEIEQTEKIVKID